MVGLHGRGSRAEKRERVFHFGADDGDVAAVVARRLFLLVAGFLLFVHDDETEIFDGRENRRTCSDNDAGFTVADAPPFACTFDVAESGVQDGYAFEARSKPGTALAANPKRECDFGHQDDGGFAARERFLHSAKIDFGFAAAGDAGEKLSAKFAEFETRANSGESALLLGV